MNGVKQCSNFIFSSEQEKEIGVCGYAGGRRLISSSYPNLAFGDGLATKIGNNVKRTLTVSCELSFREVDWKVFENIK